MTQFFDRILSWLEAAGRLRARNSAYRDFWDR